MSNTQVDALPSDISDSLLIDALFLERNIIVEAERAETRAAMLLRLAALRLQKLTAPPRR